MNFETRNAVIGQLVALLASGDFEKLFHLAPRSRVSTQEIEAVIKQYGRRLLPLPELAFELIDYIAINSTTPPAWSVVVPLFTEEEGRSDLTLELTMVELNTFNYEVQVDDIHVL
jgi:hypothetical protein